MVLFLFLVNSTGYYFLFELNRYFARQDMQGQMHDHPEQFLVFSLDQMTRARGFHRLDTNEFSYQGALYDIKREIKTGHSTVFICLHDVRESKLFAGLNRIHQNKLHLACWDHFTMIYIAVPSNEIIPSEAGNLVFPIIDISIPPSFVKTLNPPPEQA